MAQIRLKNNTGKISIVRKYVKKDPKDPAGFIERSVKPTGL
jgi:hypothetical protein